jgi:DNA-binding transcriptional ArsR family regulator
MVNNLDATFAALAEPTRRHVVELLRERPRRAGELASACAMSNPAMSRHLRVLRVSGLVEVAADDEEQREDARLRIYRLRPDRFVALSVWLDAVQAFWTDQLTAFKAHAEAQHAASSPSSPSSPAATDASEAAVTQTGAHP